MGVDGSTECPQQKVTAGADDDPPLEPDDPPPAPPEPLTGAQLPQDTEPQTKPDPKDRGGGKGPPSQDEDEDLHFPLFDSGSGVEQGGLSTPMTTFLDQNSTVLYNRNPTTDNDTVIALHTHVSSIEQKMKELEREKQESLGALRQQARAHAGWAHTASAHGPERMGPGPLRLVLQCPGSMSPWAFWILGFTGPYG